MLCASQNCRIEYAIGATGGPRMGGSTARLADLGSACGVGVISFRTGGPLARFLGPAETRGFRPVTSPRAICVQLLDGWMLTVGYRLRQEGLRDNKGK